MAMQEITAKEVTESPKNTVNWESPGMDGIQNVWLKKVYVTSWKISIRI